MQILKHPHDALTTVCPNYNQSSLDDDLATAEQMVKLMLANKNCSSLAANQVGVIRRFFVMRNGLQARVCFDPVIVRHGRVLEVKSEGCMSCPEVYVQAPRWRVVNVEYISTKGVKIRETLKGKDARVFQHELDHLNGLLIIKTENDPNESVSKVSA